MKFGISTEFSLMQSAQIGGLLHTLMAQKVSLKKSGHHLTFLTYLYEVQRNLR